LLTLLYPAYNQLTVARQPDPVPRPGEVLLKVAACGICGSELEAFKTRSPRRVPPLVLGHEFCGSVVDKGPGVERFHIGDRVISHALHSCQQCVRCLRGDIHLCAERRTYGMHLPGAYAEYVATPERTLIHWPDHMPAQAAAMTEPLVNGVHAVNLIAERRPRTVAILGAGPIGLLAQQAVQVLLGADTIVGDLIPERLAVAQRLGAALTVNSRKADFVEAVKDLTGGEGADVVIDAVGGGATKRLSVSAVRPGGVAVWLGLCENRIEINSHEITLAERFVFGSYAATMPELETARDLIADGRIDATSWIKEFPLSDGVTAFERMLNAEGDDIKAVLRPWSDGQ
jgi:threonine dehydrogenase-like Zn-dependent dehydrogenase